jgi:signal transduction histidine kinase
VVEYLWKDASVVVLRLARETAVVLEANAFARRYLSPDPVGRPFADLVLDFTPIPDIVCLVNGSVDPFILSLNTSSGHPATFRFRFTALGDGILALGSPDVEGLERLQVEVLRLNRDLSNLGRRLQKANAELERLDALKTQFLGMAAHDLRRPIGAVMAYAGFLRDEAGPSLSPEHTGFLDTIAQAGTRMSRLIDDFLEVAIIEAGRLQVERDVVTVRDLMQGVAPVIRVTAHAKGVSVEYKLPTPGLTLEADAGKLEQVLINLVANAVEHSAPGGSVTLSAHREGDTVVFAVRDEAGGIPEAQRARLFEAFERAGTRKTAGERSVGLGLAIVKRIVDAHGGTVTVESDWGRGTTFSVAIPIQGPSPLG